MKLSETIWKLSLVDNVREKLTQIQGVADRTRLHMERLADKMGATGSAGSAALGELSDQLPGIGSRITQFITNPYAAAAVAAITVATAGTKMAMEFESGMTKVNATAKLSREELDNLRDRFLDMGREGTGGNLSRLPDAFEKINSQVNNVAASTAILETSIAGATATKSDLDTVAGALAQSMSAIGLENVTAQEVMDTLVKAKELGAGEMNDFATYLPGLIASGKNLGVAYQDVAGQFAYMTAKGQDAGSAAMLLQNTYSALSKGQIQEGLKNIGVNVFDEQGSIRSFDKIFTDLNARTGQLNDEQKAKLFEQMGLVDIQAKQAFSMLLSDSNKLGEVMGGVKNSTGALQQIVDQTSSDPMVRLANLGDKFKAELIQVGYAILPYVVTVIETVANGVLWIYNTIRGWTLLMDAVKVTFWLIKVIVGFVWDSLKLVGDLIGWIYDNTLKPLVDGFMKIYETIKRLLGLDGSTIQIDSNNRITTTPAPGAPQVPNTAELPGMTGGELAKLLGGGGGADSKKVNGIHGGGTQTRNVTVTIQKLQDAIHIHSAGVKEGAEDLRRIIQEELLRAISGAELALGDG